MEEEKSLAIPLGGSTSDGSRVEPGEAVSQKSGKAAAAGSTSTLQKSGKSGSSGKLDVGGKSGGDLSEKQKPKIGQRILFGIIGLIAFLLVISVIGAGVLFFMATRDDLPTAPEVNSTMSDILVDSALEMFTEHKITVNSDEINFLLGTLVEKSSEKLASYGFEVKDLFSVVANDKATLYGRVRYKGITWPLRAVAKVSYDNPYIVVSIENAYVGKLKLPREMLIEYFGKTAVSENLSVHSNLIYYDTTSFNDKLSEVAIKQLGLEVDEIKGNNDEDEFFIVRWWNNMVDGVKNWAAGKVSDFIHDINFDNVTIIDNNLEIRVSFSDD